MSLKDKKCTAITNAFQKSLNESGCWPKNYGYINAANLTINQWNNGKNKII